MKYKLGETGNEHHQRYSPEEDAESSDYCPKHRIDYFPSESLWMCPECLAERGGLYSALRDIGSWES